MPTVEETLRLAFFDYLDDPARREALIEQAQSSTVLALEFDDLMTANPELAIAVKEEFHRFEPELRKAYCNFVEKYDEENFKSHAIGDFWVKIASCPDMLKLRELRAEQIGQLLAIKGTVTRTSEVRPELVVGSFQCNECGNIEHGVEQQFRYTEPIRCGNTACGNRDKWTLLVNQCQFVDWQKLKIQEFTEEIPSGSLPRSIDVIVRNHLVETVKAGDKCLFSGTLLALPDVAQLKMPGERVHTVPGQCQRPEGGYRTEGVTGMKELGARELTYKTCFFAHGIVPFVQSQSGHLLLASGGSEEGEEAGEGPLSAEDLRKIEQIREGKHLYHRLTSCIAPAIYGHDEVKRGILLMLCGGCKKMTREGIPLRGDINICIVGDPATAKSQFLKFVASLFPRTVYASGQGSSAAGLTASVLKDSETGEYGVEAGALMLADNGICCIDEFEKMDPKDQVAIHEAMEQQTISIAKAGIHATFNSRTCVLAAANPINGRYDRSKPLKSNLLISPPIMSRFDLFFVVVDQRSDLTDQSVARHIVQIHQKLDQALELELTQDDLRLYIRCARRIKPKFTTASAGLLSNYYAQARQADKNSFTKTAYRITVRQLESLVRLSEAIAKLHLDPEIKPTYVTEAHRLLRQSIIHIESPNIELEEAEAENDPAPAALEEEPAQDDDSVTMAPPPTRPTKASDEPVDVFSFDQASSGQESTKRRKRADTGKRRLRRRTDTESESESETHVPVAPRTEPLKITYERYVMLSNALALLCRRLGGERGLTHKRLVDAVLQWEDEKDGGIVFATQESLRHHRKEAELVLERLITKDDVLLVRGYREQDEEGDGEGEGEKARRVLVVHPNYNFSQD